MTDPARVRRTDPGNPEVCNIFHLHKAFSPPETVQHVDVQCRTAGWGCLDCKKVLFDSMNRELAPMRARAAELNAHPERVTEVLDDGAEKARRVARQTMSEVRERMGLN
jgi:tryptophanyl-tRNA synthetase